MGIPNLGAFATSDLLLTYSGVMRELRRRGVLRSNNNPVSDIAEWLAAKAFDLTLAVKSEKTFDAVASDGTRYQIKSRRLTPENDSTQLGVVRHLDARGFDYLLALYFDEDFILASAYRIPHEAVCEHSLWSEAQKGHVLHAKDALVRDPRCENVLDRFEGLSLPDA